MLGIKGAYAATGSAYDGLFFILVVVGLLFLIYLFLTFLDFLAHNGNRIVKVIKHTYSSFSQSLIKHKKTNHLDPVC
jgi:hypothetical protein